MGLLGCFKASTVEPDTAATKGDTGADSGANKGGNGGGGCGGCQCG